jgi:hypothetical protein
MPPKWQKKLHDPWPRLIWHAGKSARTGRLWAGGDFSNMRNWLRENNVEVLAACASSLLKIYRAGSGGKAVAGRPLSARGWVGSTGQTTGAASRPRYA